MSVHQRPGGTSSVRQHLVDDHGANPGWCETASDGAVLGRHDGYHEMTWAECITEEDLAILHSRRRLT